MEKFYEIGHFWVPKLNKIFILFNFFCPSVQKMREGPRGGYDPKTKCFPWTQNIQSEPKYLLLFKVIQKLNENY